MSQFWHSHWAEDAYKPGLLGNWQVPNWHPKWPCVRHCVTTTFLADKSGRLLPDKPKSKKSPWGDFKGTWELPLKIDRKLAHELSAPPKYKLAAWEAHRIHYEGPCGIPAASPKTKEKPIARAKHRKSPVKRAERSRKPVVKSKQVIDKRKEKIATKKSKDVAGMTGKVKGKEVKATSAKTKKTTEQATAKTEGGPTREKLEAMPVKDESEASEDQNTVSEESEYSEAISVVEEPACEEESITTEESEYKDDEVASVKPTVEKKYRRRHREENTTECLCETKSSSKSVEKVAPKETTNTCTVHQRLRA